MSARLVIIVIVACLAVGFCNGYLWAARQWFPRWKAGYDQGYELGKRHGRDCVRSELERNARYDQPAPLPTELPPPIYRCGHGTTVGPCQICIMSPANYGNVSTRVQ